MREALLAEVLKLRRSRLPWLTAAAFAIAAAVCGLFMFILQDTGRARALGLLGDKAQLSGATADWPGYLALLAQATAVGGLLILGTLTTWLFGREFSDRTVKDLLALPTSRSAIVAAKFVVAAGWSLLLALWTTVLGLLAGMLLELPGASTAVLAAGAARMVITALLTYALTTPFALVASAGRGYLPAVGAIFAALFSSQVVAALGYGASFPYSVPGLYAGLAGPGQDAPGPLGHLLVLTVGLTGGAATMAWWRRADHDR
ncbi:ABC transporter permease [Nonomuraea diastatica]|uniref:ABC transporter permease n=1 Tax=Nonomuraea diastatica TaxID=1848329 RepID=A0A4R4WNT9_9ACTN|nr:ABC transporter permease [Nonomuraea diastatica]TDD17755.1 ABC transporter permease [Nonomuraea diastatica]